jgi:hypothetical protein
MTKDVIADCEYELQLYTVCYSIWYHKLRAAWYHKLFTTTVRCVHAYTLHYTTVTAKDSQCFGPDGERQYYADSVRKSWVLQKKVAHDWWRMRRGKCPPVPTTPEPMCEWDARTLLQRALDSVSEHKASHFNQLPYWTKHGITQLSKLLM